MIAGHYATALIAHQRYPSGSLAFFLIVSQFQDLLWFLFHYLGLEPTAPHDVFDATISQMTVNMLYSHHLAPQIIWAAVVFMIGKLWFKSTKIGVIAVMVCLGHFVLDVFSGHAHHLFGQDTPQVTLGLYASNVYLAILIEVVFVVAMLLIFFRTESKAGVIRTTKNKIAVLAPFIYAIFFVLSVATVSFRELLNIPEFDLGFNTTMPTIIFTYIALIVFLCRVVPQHKGLNALE